MTTTQVPVPSIIKVPGGLGTATIHISMVGIITILMLVMLMALFGVTGKVSVILSSSQR